MEVFPLIVGIVQQRNAELVSHLRIQSVIRIQLIKRCLARGRVLLDFLNLCQQSLVFSSDAAHVVRDIQVEKTASVRMRLNMMQMHKLAVGD